ncbi:MAG: hypothetical protein ACK5TU_07750 [Cyclobacteriaceae bacterium]|jgi:hypothetical protein
MKSSSYSVFAFVFANCLLIMRGDTYSQNYRPFRFGFGIGKSQISNLSILSLEPSVRITDLFTVGTRIEIFDERNVQSCISLTNNVQYYLPKLPFESKKFRVFIGLGGGVYSGRHSGPYFEVTLPNGSTTFAYISESTQVRFGFYPLVGIEYGHFSILSDFNWVSEKQVEYRYLDPQVATTMPQVFFNRSDSYFSLKLGYYLGGGKQKR